MPISTVIKFEGSPDLLVWKSPVENFNATSHLIVDETHEALLVVAGQAADVFGAGEHTLSVPNIPILRSIINIPTGGETPYPCKVYYVKKVHEMDMLWGTQGPIALEDPLYDIFLHVMLRGSVSFSIDNTRKFLLKLAGFRDTFSPDSLVNKFRGLISAHVKDAISKIMINAKFSYFIMNAHLFEISEVVKEKLDEIFGDYGLCIEFFNIETIEVPKEDYAAVSEAKNRRSSRLIEGYTWQEERQMIIAEKFASNTGTMGAMGGMMGGAMGGIMMGGTISEIARNALSADRIPTTPPPKDVSGTNAPMGSNAGPASVRDVLSGASAQSSGGQTQQTAQSQPVMSQNRTDSGGIGPFNFAIATQTSETPPESPSHGGGKFCPECGAPVTAKAKFCPECGTKLSRVCPDCGTPIEGNSKFCPECGKKLV